MAWGAGRSAVLPEAPDHRVAADSGANSQEQVAEVTLGLWAENRRAACAGRASGVCSRPLFQEVGDVLEAAAEVAEATAGEFGHGLGGLRHGLGVQRRQVGVRLSRS